MECFISGVLVLVNFFIWYHLRLYSVCTVILSNNSAASWVYEEALGDQSTVCFVLCKHQLYWSVFRCVAVSFYLFPVFCFPIHALRATAWSMCWESSATTSHIGTHECQSTCVGSLIGEKKMCNWGKKCVGALWWRPCWHMGPITYHSHIVLHTPPVTLNAANEMKLFAVM